MSLFLLQSVEKMTLQSENCSAHYSVENTSLSQQMFTQVASYAGTIVAVKKIRKEHIQITRNVLLEFSYVRNLCENTP